MVSARDIRLEDGRTLQVYDSGAADDFTLLWHHGTPQTGAPLDPLLTAAARRGIRLLSYARPAYGGSSPDRAGTLRPRRPTWRSSPTRSGSGGSRRWAHPGVARTRSHVRRSCRTG